MRFVSDYKKLLKLVHVLIAKHVLTVHLHLYKCHSGFISTRDCIRLKKFLKLVNVFIASIESSMCQESICVARM